MRRVALRHDAPGRIFYFPRCFILDAQKPACLYHDLVPVLYIVRYIIRHIIPYYRYCVLTYRDGEIKLTDLNQELHLFLRTGRSGNLASPSLFNWQFSRHGFLPYALAKNI